MVYKVKRSKDCDASYVGEAKRILEVIDDRAQEAVQRDQTNARAIVRPQHRLELNDHIGSFM